MARIIFLMLVTIVFSTPAFLQVTQSWTRTYAFNPDGNARAITTDQSGNVYSAGNTSLSGNSDIHLVKYNSAGSQQWVKTFNGVSNGADIPKLVRTDESGNIYVAAITRKGFENYLSNLLVLKYSPTGTLLWSTEYNCPQNFAEVPEAMKIDNSGNVYIAGYAAIDLMFDWMVVKVSSTGSVLWGVVINGPAGGSGLNDAARDIVLDIFGNVYVTGTSDGKSGTVSTGSDYLTIKYSTSGSLIWARRYNGDSNAEDKSNGIVTDPSGNIYITGHSVVSTDPFAKAFVTIKYNGSGTEQWRRTHAGSASSGTSITRDASDNIYVGGGINNSSMLIKYNSAGVQQWERSWTDPLFFLFFIQSMQMDRYGNIYAMGQRGGEDVLMLKYTPSGNLDWAVRYGTPSTSENGEGFIVFHPVPQPPATSNSALVYVLATTNGTTIFDGDMTTIKYSQPTNNDPMAAVVEKNTDKITVSNFPNPFTNLTTFTYELPEDARVTINIYDLQGRRLQTLTDGFKSAGVHTAKFNVHAHAGGIYYYRFTARSGDKEYKETRALKKENGF